MDKENRTQQMEDLEDREAYPRDQMEEEFREGELVAGETEEEYHERELNDMHQEEVRERKEQEPAPVDKELVPLLAGRDAEEFRSRWLDIQAEFVDDPRHSVESADELVARVINSITETFASERTALEDQWNRGEEASTEDLRIAIKRYRSFFNRLLTLESMGAKE